MMAGALKRYEVIVQRDLARLSEQMRLLFPGEKIDVQSNGKNAISQLPWLGDVPVLGALFRSTSYQKDETDLAIIVTPRLVRPARPGDIIKTPLDSSLPPNDVDLFLMGKTELGPARSLREACAA